MNKVILLILISNFLLYCKNDNRDIELSKAETAIWLKNNLHSVLEKGTFAASNELEMPYRLFTPDLLNNKKVPLLIFLHGRGERGIENGSRLFETTGLFLNEYSIVAPNIQSKYPCYVLVPQCSDKTENEEWAKWVGNSPETPFKGLGKDGSYKMNNEPSESGAAALELIDTMIARLNIDADRVYITGLSMGGFGTWEFTSRRPGLFAAAVPMAGYSDPSQIEKIKHIPIWIFHGSEDELNPVDGSRTMYKILQEAGADVQYTEYDGANHGQSFQNAFNEPQLIPWVFSKTKKK